VVSATKSLTFAMLACVCSGLCCAQEYSFRTYGTSEGLTNLAIRTIYQDRVGFLWVSTENGIFRYDGERFEAFGSAQGMPHNSGAAFGDAPDGSLLVGGDFGLYQLKGNHFEAFPGQFKNVNWAQGIQTDGRGHTYVGTESGLVELFSASRAGEFSIRFLPRVSGTSGPEAYGILIDGDSLWYGCGLELCRRTGVTTAIYGVGNGLPARPVTTIRKDRGGNLWVRVRYEGVFEMPAGTDTFRRPSLPIPNDGMVGIPSLDADGRPILPAADGVWIWADQGWRKIDQSTGLRGTVYAVMEDRQHSLWIGLAGRGLVQWRGYGQWESYSAASGLPSDIVYDIQLEDSRTVWVGTEGGLARGERRPLRLNWNKVTGLTGFAVHAVRRDASDAGALWIGTETRGVARLDTETGNIRWYGDAQGLPGKSVYTLRFDREKRLWAASEVGLFEATPPYKRFFRVQEAPLSRIWAIAQGSDGTMWAGGASGLLALVDGHWRSFTTADGLSNQEVLSLGADRDGSIWVGYRFGGGIDRVHLGGHGLNVAKGIQRRGTDGLVYFLQFDSSGRLWAGTEQGVDVWDGSHWNHYDMGDGLIWNDCNLNAFAAEPSGAVWIGTSGGLSIFRPSTHSPSAMPVQVAFTKLAVGSEDLSQKRESNFHTRDNSLTVRYTALNSSAANAVLFRYRLSDADSNWTETTQREIHFALLAPGKYRLQVQAQDSEGVWSSQTAEFAFTVLAPWYQTWWFALLCTLVPIAVVGTIVRVRVIRLEREQIEFERLKAAHDEIRTLAFYDPLTALPNRRFLMDRLHKLIHASEPSRHLYGLMLVDLDNFKVLNDTLGHHLGDRLLQEAARRFSTSIPETDTIARCGGDEFVIVVDKLSEVTEKAASQVEAIAQRVLALTAQPFALDGHECLSAASIGITIFGAGSGDSDELLQQAELAMYQAKFAGKNTIRFFAPSLQEAVNQRAALEADLRYAIVSDQLMLYFQPLIDEERVIGAEALVRWNHPRRGILLPSEFISLAEETGLILGLGDWVFSKACQQSAAWATHSETASLILSVNISARQFRQPDFVDRVRAALKVAGADPGKIHLELTESLFVEDTDEIIAKMNALRSDGLNISLDDFGTGYSSLTYLRRLPLGQLKIDRSFVQDMTLDTRGRTIVKAIIDLSAGMGLSVLAEGVETKEQQELLAQLGCKAYQGFLFGRPVPIDEFEALLMSTASTVRDSETAVFTYASPLRG
jgi:diguanylate cyclase (GGDEF)-like protein